MNGKELNNIVCPQNPEFTEIRQLSTLVFAISCIGSHFFEKCVKLYVALKSTHQISPLLYYLRSNFSRIWNKSSYQTQNGRLPDIVYSQKRHFKNTPEYMCCFFAPLPLVSNLIKHTWENT